MRFSAFLAFAGLLTSCHASTDGNSRSSDDPKVLAIADFEQSIGWGGDSDPASLTTEKAHSGKWSVRVQPNVPYGYTYTRTLAEISPTPIVRMQAEAWVLRAAAGSTAKLVVQVTASATDETKVFYNAFPVEMGVVKTGEWTAIRVPITLPTSAKGINKLKVYLWNSSATTPTYLDDLTLRKAE